MRRGGFWGGFMWGGGLGGIMWEKCGNRDFCGVGDRGGDWTLDNGKRERFFAEGGGGGQYLVLKIIFLFRDS